jgi:hypothetical protein
VTTALALGACGSSGDEEAGTPLACTTDSRDYLEALATAPEEALLDGETPISGCIVPEQSTADLSDVGATLVEAASSLNEEARRDPGGEASVQLGYLVGSVEEGASETQGIHADLVLRVSAAARFPGEDGGTLPAAFERQFGAGYAAAREAG